MVTHQSYPSGVAEWADVCRWIAANRPDLDEKLRDGVPDHEDDQPAPAAPPPVTV